MKTLTVFLSIFIFTVTSLPNLAKAEEPLRGARLNYLIEQLNSTQSQMTDNNSKPLSNSQKTALFQQGQITVDYYNKLVESGKFANNSSFLDRSVNKLISFQNNLDFIFFEEPSQNRVSQKLNYLAIKLNYELIIIENMARDEKKLRKDATKSSIYNLLKEAVKTYNAAISNEFKTGDATQKQLLGRMNSLKTKINATPYALDSRTSKLIPTRYSYETSVTIRKANELKKTMESSYQKFRTTLSSTSLSNMNSEQKYRLYVSAFQALTDYTKANNALIELPAEDRSKVITNDSLSKKAATLHAFGKGNHFGHSFLSADQSGRIALIETSAQKYAADLVSNKDPAFANRLANANKERFKISPSLNRDFEKLGNIKDLLEQNIINKNASSSKVLIAELKEIIDVTQTKLSEAQKNGELKPQKVDNGQFNNNSEGKQQAEDTERQKKQISQQLSAQIENSKILLSIEEKMRELEKLKSQFMQTGKRDPLQKSILFDKIVTDGRHFINQFHKTFPITNNLSHIYVNRLINIKNTTLIDFFEVSKNNLQSLRARTGNMRGYKIRFFKDPKIIGTSRVNDTELKSKAQDNKDAAKKMNDPFAKASIKTIFLNWINRTFLENKQTVTPTDKMNEQAKGVRENNASNKLPYDPYTGKYEKPAKVKPNVISPDNPKALQELLDKNMGFKALGETGMFIGSFIKLYGLYVIGDLGMTMYTADQLSNPLAWDQLYERVNPLKDPTAATLTAGAVAGQKIYNKYSSPDKQWSTLNATKGIMAASLLFHIAADLIRDYKHGDLGLCLQSKDPIQKAVSCEASKEKWGTKDQYASYAPFVMSIGATAGVSIPAFKGIGKAYSSLSNSFKKTKWGMSVMSIKDKSSILRFLAGVPKSSPVVFVGGFVVIMVVDRTIALPAIKRIWEPLNFNSLGFSISNFLKENKTDFNNFVKTYDQHKEEMNWLDRKLNQRKIYDYSTLTASCKDYAENKIEGETQGHHFVMVARKKKLEYECERRKDPTLIVKDSDNFRQEKINLILAPYMQQMNNWQLFITNFRKLYDSSYIVYKYFADIKRNEKDLSDEEIENLLSMDSLRSLLNISDEQNHILADSFPHKYQNFEFSHITDYIVYQMACGPGLSLNSSDSLSNVFLKQRNGSELKFIPPRVVNDKGIEEKIHLCMTTQNELTQKSERLRREENSLPQNDVFASIWSDISGKSYDNLALYVFENLQKDLFTANQKPNLTNEQVETDNTDISNEQLDTNFTQEIKVDPAKVSENAVVGLNKITEGIYQTEVVTNLIPTDDSFNESHENNNTEDTINNEEFEFSWWDRVIHTHIQMTWSHYENSYINFTQDNLIRPLVGNTYFVENSTEKIKEEQSEILDTLSLKKLSIKLYGNQEGLLVDTYTHLYKSYQRIEKLEILMGYTGSELSKALAPFLELLHDHTIKRRKFVAAWNHSANPFFNSSDDGRQIIDEMQIVLNNAKYILQEKDVFYSKENIELVLSDHCEPSSFDDINGQYPGDNIERYTQLAKSFTIEKLTCGKEELAKRYLIELSHYKLAQAIFDSIEKTYLDHLNRLAPFLNAIGY